MLPPFLLRPLTLASPTILFLFSVTASAKEDIKIDYDTIELAPFVVYSGIIDMVDGITGESYTKSDPVVMGFRQSFNELLLWYHRRLLTEELTTMRQELAVKEAMAEEISTLMERFDYGEFSYNKGSFMATEKAITKRLLDDPFFIIEELVVWDLDRLENYKDQRPISKYAKDIRYNPERGKWERRVTTKWEVPYRHQGKYYKTIKEQGLNLDTNEGFHLINRGLQSSVMPRDFKDVKLTYPIFVDPDEPVEAQIQSLKYTFILNLHSIYDPYSWAWRRNVRLDEGFNRPIWNQVKKQNLKVSEEDWLIGVLVHLIKDVATIKHRSSDWVYEQAMIRRLPVNGNILGEGFDLLNWNNGENRSIGYDPKTTLGPQTNFESPAGARFILLDAYRRYEDRFLQALADSIKFQKIQKQQIPAQELVKQVLEELSGIPADQYIKLAAEAQRKELSRFKLQP